MEGACGLDAASFCGLMEVLYQTVQRPEAWVAVLALLCQHLGADSGMIRFYARGWSAVDLTLTHGFDPSFTAAYREHFVHLDPIPGTIERAMLPPGVPALLDAFIPHSELKRTEFYSDYLLPQDKRHVIGGHLLGEDGAKVLFGLQRSHRRRPFEESDKPLLRLLAPHFQQALRLHRAFSDARVEARAAGGALDGLNVAVFFLDKAGRVRFANDRAEDRVRAREGLSLRHGRLHATHPGRDRQLQQLIGSAAGSVPGEQPGPGGALRITPGHNGRPGATAYVTAWHRCVLAEDPIAPSVAAAVLVGPSARPVRDPSWLSGAYGLTRAEARLVARLVETCDLRQAAEAAGVTRETARAYLKSVFRKTECRSQVELIGKILASPGALWTGTEVKSPSLRTSGPAGGRNGRA